MKRIGVVSDTHIPGRAKELPQILIDGLKGTDLVIHAGDLTSDYVLYELQAIAPVEAVAGNVDGNFIWNMLKRKKIITVENCRIGIIHGDGFYGTTVERVAKAFAEDDVNCIVFGHSHMPYNKIHNNILFFNPGSPTDKRTQKKYSYGIIEVNGNSVKGEIRFF